jgi:hypothetical protein
MWRCGCRHLKHLNRNKKGNRGDPNSPGASKAGSCLNVTDDLYVILSFSYLLQESWLFSISNFQLKTVYFEGRRNFDDLNAIKKFYWLPSNKVFFTYIL